MKASSQAGTPSPKPSQRASAPSDPSGKGAPLALRIAEDADVRQALRAATAVGAETAVLRGFVSLALGLLV